MSNANRAIPGRRIEIGTTARRNSDYYGIAAVFLALILCVAADGSWLRHVPEADRHRENPYAGQADAIAAGSKMFADHCAKCHGPDALGRGKHPSLRSDRVQHATDGEVAWLLRNGNLGHGMPSWSAIPEPSRWQIIAYVKSLGPAEGGSSATPASAVPSEPSQPQPGESQ